MQFLQVYALLLLCIPLFLFLYSFTKKSNSLEKFFSKEILDKLRLNHLSLSQTLRYRLFLVALVFFILALARPVHQNKSLSMSRMKNSLVIALDMSKSMEKSDIYPSRKALAKQKLLHLLKLSSSLHVGILFFAQEAYMLYPISEDTEAMYTLLQNAQLPKIFAPNTNIFASLEGSSEMLLHESSKNIILLSDGGEDTPRDTELKYLQKHKIKLYTIALSKQNLPHLKTLSKKSGGEFVYASWGDSDIKAILHAIKTQKGEATKETFALKSYQEYFRYPLFFAIFLLFFAYQSSLKLIKIFMFVAFSLVSFQTPLKADILDFYRLHKARAYYSNAEYTKASQEYAQVTKSSHVYYNYAGSLYKAKEYQKAIQIYKKALSQDKLLNAKIYHNIANANVYIDKLSLAKSYYEKALQEHIFVQTQENLALISEVIHKRKKLLAKDGTKVKFRDHLSKEKEFFHTSAKYSIHLETLFLDEEARWLQLISKQKSPLFLQKITTSRRSLDANSDD